MLVNLIQFRALHEKDEQRMSRAKFFLIALICSFSWYAVPGYLFPTLTTISWVCWAFSKSVTAQQLGSGMRGLGIGAFTLDWSAVAAFMFSPLIYPFFAIANVYVGFILIVYVVIPVCYWGFDLYNAKTFPLFSSHLFTATGHNYNITAIVNDKFEIDRAAYSAQGKLHLSMFFALTYGFGFATIASTLTHVALFNGREVYERFRASYKGKEDIHTRLMRKYKDIPDWWFYLLLVLTVALSLVMCTALKHEIQMPWWGLLFACVMAFVFTLPISIITATTNQTPGLNIITEYVMGLILPGKPIANVCFKVYGYMSMTQAISFLADFKLGHYMKIPPRSMFLVQFVGTIIAGTVNISVAWWLLNSVTNICRDELLPPNSPWTCPGDRVFFDASVIWGLVGPKRIFGSLGNYGALNWFFLGGAVGPFIVWLLHKAFPKQTWIPLINLPVLLGATAMMPPATALNYNAWAFVGTIFNFFIFRYRKKWWQRYNYVLSAALDAGVAFMGVLLYFTLGLEDKSMTWWGTGGEHCDLARCPTAKGVDIDGLHEGIMQMNVFHLGALSRSLELMELSSTESCIEMCRWSKKRGPERRTNGREPTDHRDMKEHVLISIFADAGYAFGIGSAYAVMIVDIIKAFYPRSISFNTGSILIITAQVIGYGWGRAYFGNTWPSALAQVSLLFMLALHVEEHQMSLAKFFLIALICSFSWYVLTSYLFPTLTSISWFIIAQRLSSGMKSLGLGAFTLD
ncbi:oligopeptide transporter 4 [Asimina triloba]